MIRRLALTLAAAGLVAAAAAAPAAPSSHTVRVAFVRGDRLVRVERVAPRGVAPEAYALRELLRGPTSAERARGLRTAFPEQVRLRFVRQDGDVWRARFSRSLIGPATAKTMQKRFWQIAATLFPLGPERYVAISAEGRLVTTVRLGARPGRWRPERGEKGYLYDVHGAQLRLFTLGFLDRSDVSGALDYATSQALLAFQGWEDLGRTGTVTDSTQVALFHASRPKPTAHSGGRRIEIHRLQGVLLMVEGNAVVRAVHTSTGAYGRTPVGTFRVYRKEQLSWSVPFHVWMPYASYFDGPFAMHEYPYVPDYPASHGCVRLPAGDAQRVYRFADIGTPVRVF